MPSFLPPAFHDFLLPGTDRVRFIRDALAQGGVPHSVLDMAGSRNVIVRFGPSAYRAGRRVKCFSAHYDRAGDTPGANDNSAACFQLLSFAFWLRDFHGPHDCMIILSDNEELGSQRRTESQGSFAIAEGFRRLGLEKPWIFSLDCTGRGDRLVLSTSAYLSFPGSPPLVRLLDPLQTWTSAFLEQSFTGEWAAIPTPHSENLGYLVGGLSSVSLTVLPDAELRSWIRALAANPLLPDILLKREYRTEAGTKTLNAAMPPTWLLIHGKDDLPESLDPVAFGLMSRFLSKLAAAEINRA